MSKTAKRNGFRMLLDAIDQLQREINEGASNYSDFELREVQNCLLGLTESQDDDEPALWHEIDQLLRPFSPSDLHPVSSLDSLILSLADLERRVSNSLESLTIEQMDALNASVQTFTHTVRYQLQVTAGQKEIS